MNKSNERIAIYCRVACPDNDAIYFQRRELVAYAKAQGHTEIKIYADNGFSGLTLNRPQLNKLKAAIRAGEISTVIVKSFSRIGRNPIDIFLWRREMEKMGVTVISLTEPSGLLDISPILAAALKGGAVK